MATAERARPRPAVLVGLGAATLIGSALVGWGFRALRPGDPEVSPRVPAAMPSKAVPGDRGRLVFQVHCARCHGAEGHGDGPDAAALRAAPRDFRDPAWQPSASREAVRRAVVEGVPKGMMAALGASLSPVELDAVVDRVMSLTGIDVPPELLARAGFQPATTHQQAPPLDVLGMDRQAIGLERFRGKLIVVDFWGTTCLPCQEDLPDLAALAARFEGDGLAVLSVCVDEADPDAVRSVAAARAPGLRIAVDPTGMARLAYDVQALPSAALIGPDGRLLGQAQGRMDWSGAAMRSLIRAALGIKAGRGEGR